MNAKSATSRNLQLPPSPQNEHVLRRIAMFLMELSIQVSAEVMNRLTPEELRGLTAAIEELELIDPRSANEVFLERQSMKANAELLAKLGSPYAWHFVNKALRPEPAGHRSDADGETKTFVGWFGLPVVTATHFVDGQ
jgi:flagellar motor switch protein FliG